MLIYIYIYIHIYIYIYIYTYIYIKIKHTLQPIASMELAIRIIMFHSLFSRFHRYRIRYSEYMYHLLRHNPRCLHVAPVRRYVIVINKTVFSTASAISLIKWPSFAYGIDSYRRGD